MRRQPINNLAVAALIASMIPAITLGQQSVAESFQKVSGDWGDSAMASKAQGLTTPGSMVLAAADGQLSGAVSIALPVGNAAKYDVQLTWPSDANARNVTVIIEGPDGQSSRTIDMKPASAPDSNADSWVSVAEAWMVPNSTYSMKVVADASTGPVVEGEPWQVAVDGIRMVATQVSDTPMDDDNDPFGTPIAEENSDSPFGNAPITDEAITANPFVEDSSVDSTAGSNPWNPDMPAATIPSAASSTMEPASDPFGDGTAAPETSSNDHASASPVGDPWGDPPAEVASIPDDPWGESAAESEPAIPDDPWGDTAVASAPTDEAENLQIPDDPFGIGDPEPVTDPFASDDSSAAALAIPDDPFGDSMSASSSPSGGIDPMESNLDSLDPFGDSASTASVAPTTGSGSGSLEGSGIAGFPTKAELEESSTLDWSKSISTAKADAARTDRPIFILFSGRSVQAENYEKVLEQKEVADMLKDFELVKIDYRKNRQLAGQYAVSSYPYIVVLNSKGYTVGHMTPIDDIEVLIEEVGPFAQPAFLR